MRIKKLLLLLLTAAALLLPAGCGEDPDAWETPASDFTYEIDDDGVRITAYTGSRAWVRIPAAIDGAPVVAIGEKAFFRAGITELSIPESVTEIGRSAFTGNEKLCTVEMRNDPAREGGLVYFGGLFWRVLEWNADESRALVLSEDILEVRPYHSEWTAMTWKECDLRAYLNGEFLEDTFTEEERARIRLGNVNTPYCNGNPGGGITKDSVFLLSADEAAAYFPDDASRAACEIIKENAVKTKLFDRCRVVCSDWKSFVKGMAGRASYSLLLLDPPYKPGAVDEILSLVIGSGLLTDDAVVIAETAADGVPVPPDGWTAKAYRYGKTYVTILRAGGNGGPAL